MELMRKGMHCVLLYITVVVGVVQSKSIDGTIKDAPMTDGVGMVQSKSIDGTIKDAPMTDVVGVIQSKSIYETIKDELDNSPLGKSVGYTTLSDGSHLVELDIILTPEEWEAKKQKEQDDYEGHRSKRQAIPDSDRRWTNKTIPYTVGSGFDSKAMQHLQSAMSEWEENTCVMFRPATDADRNYVMFVDGEGCSSYVGMVGISGQVVNLGGTCKVDYVILHEIGHALGLVHHQTRQDRDDYVWVRFEYMDPRYQYNNDKQDENNYGVMYDYSSIMHYTEGAFSICKEPVIITHDPSWQTRIGSSRHLSFGDIKIMNLMYNCGEHCGNKSCPGEGFLDKNCQCMCPGNPTAPCVTIPDPCTDKDENCDIWARIGYCKSSSKYSTYMKAECMRSCDFCGPTCQDDLLDCQTRAYNGDCKMIPLFMFEKCKKSCGICYGKELQSSCLDTDPNCAYLASIGECNKNPDYMRQSCKRACASC